MRLLPKKFFIYIIVSISLKTTVCAQAISQNWKFRQADKAEWYSATVPSSIHTELLKHKLIPDPYYRDNEKLVQWVEDKDWEYKTSFDIAPDVFSNTNLDLLFKGLDTYADVYLNDSLILKADNMYRSWNVNCKKLLKPTNNILRILFHSAVNEGLRKASLYSYRLPNHNEKTIESRKSGSQTRKSPHQFGWDTHPRLVTCGVWRPIVLKAWSDAKIDDIFFKPVKISASVANYNVITNISALKEKKYKLSLYLNTTKISQQTISLKKGANNKTFNFTINNPKLWWPNGMGKPNLYSTKIVLTDENGILDEKNTKIGVRTIEVVQEKDTIGKSFYFKINGLPLFIKGSNYVPADALVTKVTNKQTTDLIISAKDANLNLLRVWGGAIYENDLFYDLCAENGLLVWQDFMYACSMYPGDDAFLENIKQETIENVIRLRNNPSLALWCGNNELISGWFEWGWPKKPALNISATDSAQIFHDYQKIFTDIIPTVVKQYNPQTFYWPSSPGSDPGVKSSHTSGDLHYYLVWYGSQSIQTYKTAIPRFMSEYGVQSFPSYYTVKKYLAPEDENLFSPVMMSRQKSEMPWISPDMEGNKMLMRYLNEDYKTPKDFESLVYVSQLFQADAIKIASEAHRINKPYCMGSMFWQFGDAWPNIGWSVIDYLGKKKAAFYTAKKAFKTVAVIPALSDTIISSNTKLNVFINSDSSKRVIGKLSIKLLDFSGKLLVTKDVSVQIPPFSNAIFYTTPVNELLNGLNKDELVLSTTFTVNNLTQSENLLYFNHLKFLQLQKPLITTTIVQKGETTVINLITNSLAKSVYLSMPNGEDNFSDNFFDLLPNQPIQIKLNTKMPLKLVKSQLSIKSLFNSY